MKKWHKILILVSILINLFPLHETQAEENIQDIPVIHAILFFSPTCGACHKVITEDLPPLIEKYGNQLQLIGINVATVEGQELYQDFISAWNIPEEDRGVPCLVIGDSYYIGAVDIPENLPGIIETGLMEGGIDLPDIPGISDIFNQSQEPDQTPTAEITENILEPTPSLTSVKTKEFTPTALTNTEQPIETPSSIASIDDTTSLIIPDFTELSLADRFKRDLAGNILAVVVLTGMLISVIWILIRILTPLEKPSNDFSWSIPVLSAIGLIVAGYLSFVEVTQSKATCGPIGDCNTVQESPYAILFGFLPVGVLGLIGYIAILSAWLLRRYGPESLVVFSTLSMWGMALFGVFFSIYLTYLEPFVIGATCAWCISSAVIITLQLWASTEPVRQIWSEPEDEQEEVEKIDSS